MGRMKAEPHSLRLWGNTQMPSQRWQHARIIGMASAADAHGSAGLGTVVSLSGPAARTILKWKIVALHIAAF